MIEIDFLSTEMVTPSSPTPHHLNHYKLSLFDQRISHYIPLGLFYPAKDNLITNNHQKLIHLKKSLSQALTLYYPLAGRLVGNSHVNCNDEGVTFIEARANCKLYDAITDPIPEEISKFFPSDGRDHSVLFVQATFFLCGGLAIGFAVSHKLVDGSSIFTFINSWAAISRGEDVVQLPKFESAVLFPPIDLGSINHFEIEKKEKVVIKRFVFTAQKIEELREMYYTFKNLDEGLIGFSRTEILSAFIWTRFMVSTGAKDDVSKVYTILLSVDIRARLVPPLSEYHFGNFVLSATSVPSLKNNDDRTKGLLKKIRGSIQNVDTDYASIKKKAEKASKASIGDDAVVMFNFSSVCNAPIFKSDFGWGKPVWWGIAKMPVSNTVFFLNTLSGRGIEAWVHLKEQDMAKFQIDEELLQYVKDTNLRSRI